MSIIGRIIGLIVAKSIGNKLQRQRDSTNLDLIYDDVVQRIDRRSTRTRNALLHLVIYTAVMVILKLLVENTSHVSINILLLMGVLWAIFGLMPHMFAAIMSATRWSPEEDDPVEKSKNDDSATQHDC